MPPDSEDIVERAVEHKLADLRQPKKQPRWLFDTLKDNKLDALLPAHTKAAAKHDQGNYVATACDEEPVCNRDAIHSWFLPYHGWACFCRYFCVVCEAYCTC